MALVSNDSQVVLGTDSLASNHSLDILSEIRLVKENYPFITDETLLRWATINGARALNLDDSLGSFEKEKKPGVLLLSSDLSTVTRLI
jgi:cytosine/adenosine deaminase-related metal-dependent hydrolase